MKDVLFNSYIARNYSGGCLTEHELHVLKEGNLDAMVSTFVKMRNERYIQQLQCVLRSFQLYLGNDITLEQVAMKRTYDECFMGCQLMDGDADVFFGIGGEAEALLLVSSRFAGEDFSVFDTDAYDAVCELINCTNGLFATRLSDEKIEVVLRPPVFYGNTCISGENDFYVVTMGLEDARFDVILSLADRVCLESRK